MLVTVLLAELCHGYHYYYKLQLFAYSALYHRKPIQSTVNIHLTE